MKVVAHYNYFMVVTLMKTGHWWLVIIYLNALIIKYTKFTNWVFIFQLKTSFNIGILAEYKKYFI